VATPDELDGIVRDMWVDHQARRLGLITVEERRRPGQRSLTNIVRIISKEWLTWLRKGPRASGGSNPDGVYSCREVL
jgi:hypothetical protein